VLLMAVLLTLSSGCVVDAVGSAVLLTLSGVAVLLTLSRGCVDAIGTRHVQHGATASSA
jgi:hypothetical protein